MQKLQLLLIGSCLVLLAVFTISCEEENLDVLPGSITEANYFKSEVDFERGVIGAYAKLTDFYWFNNNNPIHGFWQLPGDDMTTLGLVPFEVFGTLQPGTGFVSYYYQQSYQMISRTNTVLEKLDEETDIYTTPGLKDAHRGEVLFLRGWMNFQLWNYFGSAPLITQRIGLENSEGINPESSSENELIDQAIADITEAATLLPASWPATDAGRVTSNSANGLLAKALVYRGTVTNNVSDHEAAVVAADRISGVSLVENYSDNFSAFTENNAESLFEFQASQPADDNVWLPNDFEQGGAGSTSAYWGYYDSHWSLFGKPRFTATSKFIMASDTLDPRTQVNIDPATGNVLKYVTNNSFTNNGVGSSNNPRILRLADVLLIKAEAIVQSGGSLQEALDLVNMVRARANAMDPDNNVPASLDLAGSSADEVMDIIRNERMVELFGEGGHRWLDLRRWHLGGQIDLTDFDFSSARDDFMFEEKNLYYPIPLSELDLNPNARQNPGY